MCDSRNLGCNRVQTSHFEGNVPFVAVLVGHKGVVHVVNVTTVSN